MHKAKACPDRELLTAFLAGKLSAEEDAQIGMHLEGCAACEAHTQQLEQQSDPLIDALRRPAPLSGPTVHADNSIGASKTALWGDVPLQAASCPLQVDGYHIIREIGRGGMGVVYEAYQHRLKRPVAIKMILTGSIAGADERVRFLMEGELLARLNHANFVQVYEVGTVELSPGTVQPYLVMEYVDGGNLKAKMHHAPMPIRDAARCVWTLARAMEAAHAQGIIHRDLKPANVLIAQDGALKITDFGLAKELHASGSLTPTGMTLGTPHYMAPEQAAAGRAAAVGPGADIYALGAILYEMLTGQPPFPGEAPMQVILDVLEKAPQAPSRLRPDVPRDLQTICLKCLRKEPQGRYASARALAADLECWLENRPIRARPVRGVERAWKWIQRHPLSASLLVFLVLSLLGGSAVSTYFGFSANERAQEKENALIQEAQARRAAQRRAAELQLVAGQRLAADGEVDRGMFTMVRGWAQAPEEDADLQRVFRRNLEAWAGHLPRLRWYLETPKAEYFAHVGNEVIWATPNEVSVHDAATGLALGAPRTFPGQTIAALSADGQRVGTHVLGDSAFILRVFERATGIQAGKDIIDQRGAELRAKNPSAYYRLAFSADQKMLMREFVSLTLQERQLWDSATGAPFAPPLVGNWPAVRLLRAENGAWYWLVISEKDGVEVRSVSSGARLGDALALPSDARLPELYPHARMFQASLRVKVKWWEFSEKAPRSSAWPLSATIGMHAVSDDGRYLSSVLGQHRLCWHDLAARQLCIPTAGVDAGAGELSRAHDTRSCLYFRNARFLKRIDFPRLLPVHTMGTTPGEGLFRAPPAAELQFEGALFSADRDTALLYGVAQVRQKSYARLISTRDNRPLGLPMTDCDTRAVLSPSGRLIALATWDDPRDNHPPLIVRVYDARSGEPRSRSWQVKPYMHTLAFSPDETRLAVGHVHGVELCNLVTGDEAVSLPQPGPITRLLFSRDGRRLALVSRRGWWDHQAGLRVWDVLTAKPVGAFVRMENAPLIFTEDGDAFRTIELDGGRMRRWTFEAAAPVAELTPLADWPTVPRGRDIWALRADNQRLALGSRHGAIWQWDLVSGKRLGPTAEFHQPCLELQYAPDGNWLAVSGDDGDVALFDPLTAKQLGPLLSQRIPVRTMTFTPDSSELITVLRDGRCVRWPMGMPHTLTGSQWALWLEAATGMRLDAETLMPLSVAEHRQRLDAARALPLPLELPQMSDRQWHAEQALNAEYAGQFNSARWHLDRWIASAPKEWVPHARRARINALQGLADDARVDLKNAAALCQDGELENWRRHQSALAAVLGTSLFPIEAKAH